MVSFFINIQIEKIGIWKMLTINNATHKCTKTKFISLLKQIFGTPMRSDISKNNLWKPIYPNRIFHILLLIKIVNYIICVIPKNSLTHILSIFSSYNNYIRFLSEEVWSSSFVETTLIINEDYVILDKDRKPIYNMKKVWIKI